MIDAPAESCTVVPDLLSAQKIPDDGILTRTLLDAAHLKTVLFTFSAGQELSEHTASVPAVMHVLQGKAKIGIGAEAVDAGPGTWIHMPANMKHSIRADTPVVMLLLMFKGGA